MSSASVKSSVTDSVRLSSAAASSAACPRPVTRHSPSLSMARSRAGATGSEAAPISAAIFGAIDALSAVHPAISRMLTKAETSRPFSSAISAKSGLSWVQATTTGASPSMAPSKVPIWLRHRCV